MSDSDSGWTVDEWVSAARNLGQNVRFEVTNRGPFVFDGRRRYALPSMFQGSSPMPMELAYSLCERWGLLAEMGLIRPQDD